jgi:hypothetical protein
VRPELRHSQIRVRRRIDVRTRDVLSRRSARIPHAGQQGDEHANDGYGRHRGSHRPRVGPQHRPGGKGFSPIAGDANARRGFASHYPRRHPKPVVGAVTSNPHARRARLDSESTPSSTPEDGSSVPAHGESTACAPIGFNRLAALGRARARWPRPARGRLPPRGRRVPRSPTSVAAACPRTLRRSHGRPTRSRSVSPSHRAARRDESSHTGPKLRSPTPPDCARLDTRSPPTHATRYPASRAKNTLVTAALHPSPCWRVLSRSLARHGRGQG